MNRPLLNMFMMIVIGLSTAFPLGTPQPGSQVLQKIDTTFSTSAGAMHITNFYLLSLPKDYSTFPDSLWPTIMFHHPAGAEKNTWMTEEQIVAQMITQGTPHACAAPLEHPNIADRFIVISPQVCNGDQAKIADSLSPFYDWALAKYRCDKNRVYVTGICYGASVAWAIAVKRPEIPAALELFTFGGPYNSDVDETKASLLSPIPLRIFHNHGDNTISWNLSKRAFDKITASADHAFDQEYLMYWRDDHFAWDVEPFLPRYYDFLIRQKKSAVIRANQASGNGIAIFSDTDSKVPAFSAPNGTLGLTGESVSEGAQSLKFRFTGVQAGGYTSIRSISGSWLPLTITPTATVDISQSTKFSCAVRYAADTMHGINIAFTDIHGASRIYGGWYWPTRAAVVPKAQWSTIDLSKELFTNELDWQNDTIPFDEKQVASITFFINGTPGDTGSIYLDNIRFINNQPTSINHPEHRFESQSRINTPSALSKQKQGKALDCLISGASIKGDTHRAAGFSIANQQRKIIAR